jgi:hypothetical protein
MIRGYYFFNLRGQFRAGMFCEIRGKRSRSIGPVLTLDTVQVIYSVRVEN